MTRVLVTGGGGFVAPYVLTALTRSELPVESIVIAGKVLPSVSQSGVRAIGLDVTDASAVEVAIADMRPTHVVHLAGVSSLPSASADPDLAWKVNVYGSLNIARAMVRRTPQSLLVFASSGQIYGETAKSGNALTEDDLLQPTSEYAVTKASADLALGAMSHHGLKCVRLRLFNHAGAGQTEDFALPSFAGQIARIEAGLQEPVIKVGNLEAERDFLHVQDVADAYVATIKMSPQLPPGLAMNIASGIPLQMRILLDRLITKSSVKINIENDAGRNRPVDIKRMFGDRRRATEHLKWEPSRSIDQMLDDILAYARSRCRALP